MKRVLKSFLTVAMTMAMVGLAVTQARADRITLNGGCASLSCNPETLTVRGSSLSFVAASLMVDIDTSNSAGLEFAADVVGGSDLSVASAGAPAAKKESVAQLGVKDSGRPASTAEAFLSNSMLWSFSGAHNGRNETPSSPSLALPVGNRGSGSFSVVAGNVANAPSIPSAQAKAGPAFRPSGTAEPDPKSVSAPAVPEQFHVVVIQRRT